MDKELEEELKGINEDRQKYMLELANEQKKFAQMLMAEMGKDMEDVLSGKVKVELSPAEKKRYKKNKWINKIKRFFARWS